MKLDMTPERRQATISAIRKFFLEEREEEIGIIAADKVLDFFIGTLGTEIYNMALQDVKSWFTRILENLEIDYDQLYKR
jgi:uncharacterized protein (DUF2164 family)